MRLFKYRKFQKWAKDEGIMDTTLMNALNEIEHGLFDANLGGGLYKKRVARPGQGKRGSYRVLLAFRHGDRCIFIFGFAKNEIANIDDKTKEIFQRLSQYFLSLNDEKLEQAINIVELIEVML